MKSLLRITAGTGKGFQMTFENGWTVSVQFGRGNYCSNRDLQFGSRAEAICADAEVARWPEGSSVGQHNDIHGWKTPDEVAAFITETANL